MLDVRALDATQNRPSREEIATAEAEPAIAVAPLEAIRKMRHRARQQAFRK